MMGQSLVVAMLHSTSVVTTGACSFGDPGCTERKHDERQNPCDCS